MRGISAKQMWLWLGRRWLTPTQNKGRRRGLPCQHRWAAGEQKEPKRHLIWKISHKVFWKRAVGWRIMIPQCTISQIILWCRDRQVCVGEALRQPRKGDSNKKRHFGGEQVQYDHHLKLFLFIVKALAESTFEILYFKFSNTKILEFFGLIWSETAEDFSNFAQHEKHMHCYVLMPLVSCHTQYQAKIETCSCLQQGYPAINVTM